MTDPATGGVAIDADGQPVYPAVRDLTRDPASDYYQLQELTDFTIGDTRYVVLAGDATFLRSLINTVSFAIVIVPIQSAFGLVLALLVNRRMRGVNFFRTAYFLPVVTSMVVISLLWKFMYSADRGLINQMRGAQSPGHPTSRSA